MLLNVGGNRAGYDIDKYIIASLNAIKNGWIPFSSLSKSEYQEIKENPKTYNDYILGYVGYELSFGARWFSGYGGGEYKGKCRVEQGKNNAIKTAPMIKGCIFQVSDYRNISIPEKSIIYCDPPYKGTTEYKIKGFNHTDFWEWCRKKSKEGHSVFVSEKQAPDDFKVVWEQEFNNRMSKSNKTKITEKLYKQDRDSGYSESCEAF